MDPQADNIVFVGNKPVMNYVLACLTLFQNGSKEVYLKARGRAISRAVDTAQILTQRFVPDCSVKKIDINTEELRSPESGEMNLVSSMEIHLSM